MFTRVIQRQQRGIPSSLVPAGGRALLLVALWAAVSPVVRGSVADLPGGASAAPGAGEAAWRSDRSTGTIRLVFSPPSGPGGTVFRFSLEYLTGASPGTSGSDFLAPSGAADPVAPGVAMSLLAFARDAFYSRRALGFFLLGEAPNSSTASGLAAQSAEIDCSVPDASGEVSQDNELTNTIRQVESAVPEF